MSAVRGWQAFIDWSGGGGLTGPLEDVTQYVNKEPVTVTWGRSTDGVDLATAASEMKLALLNRTVNWTRYFSPENTSSPIYGRIMPGRTGTLTRTVRGNSTVYAETWSASTAGWTAPSGGTITRVASPSEDGNGALSYVPPGAVAVVGAFGTPTIRVGAEPEGTFIVSFRAMSTSTWTDVTAVLDWYDITGVFISTSGALALTTTTAWTTISSTNLTPPANAYYARPRFRFGSTPPNTNTFYIDNVTVTSIPDDSGKTYTLFSGPLDDYDVASGDAAWTFSGSFLDAWGRPALTDLSTLAYSGIRTGDAVNLVLDAIGWTAPRAIDPGATLIGWWWEEGTDPGDAINKLVNSEGSPAIAYVEGGTFVFRDRHHRTRSAASITSQAVFSSLIPAGSGNGLDFKFERDPSYNHGTKSIVNTATFSVGLRRAVSRDEIWSQDDPIALGSGSSIVIFAQPGDPAFNVIPPSMASGTIEASSGTFTATIDQTSGQKFAITLTSTSSGTVTRLALQGSSLPITRTVQAKARDAGSAGRVGESSWPGEVPWANQYDAQAVADRVVAIYASERPRIAFSVVAINDRYLSMMLKLRISDRITYRDDVIGVSRDFHVERLTHQVTSWNSAQHRLIVEAVRADPLPAANAFLFGVSGHGFDDGVFGVTGIEDPDQMFVFDQAGQGFDQGVFAT